MTATTATLFREARLLAETNRAAGVDLFARIVELPPGPEWADAQLEVAGWAHQQYSLEDARRRYQSILDADSTIRSEEAWRTTAVMLSRLLEDVDEPVDTDLLCRGLAACAAAGDEYLAGIAAGLLGRIERAAGRPRAARDYFERAVTHYDAAGSMIGGPGAALQIAVLCVAEGDAAAANDWLRRGLDQVAKFPYGGRCVRETRQKLEAFMKEIRSE